MSPTDIDKKLLHGDSTSVEADEEGLEKESVGFPDRITKPFDPNLIDVSTKTFTIDLILKRIRMGELNLSPDFQRHDGIWSVGAQSRLIESLLIRIPLPAFYIDATNEEEWLVVDGLQRLSTLRNFVTSKSLRLTELEFLSQLEGKSYDELPRSMQRRIMETQIVVYLIERDTQPEVKFNVFKRINTGGLPLSAQEIRHALNQGPATKLLNELAETREFKTATSNGVNPKRMGDRECVLRFLAFTMRSPEDYSTKDLDSFLNSAMAQLNRESRDKLKSLKSAFCRAMDTTFKCFDAYAFRKRYSMEDEYKYPINKALFEVWSVNLGHLSEEERDKIVKRKRSLQSSFCIVMSGNRDFETAISQGTGDPAKVKLRFSETEKIIRKVLND